jgi:uncharacterized membrane protein
MERALFILVCFTALGSAIVGGIFYGFSSFVMKALGRIPPEQGVSAMNSINVVVINPSFMLAFMGTALASLALAIASILWWQHPGAGPVLAAALLYVAGVFAVTMLMNQPMNLALAGMQPSQALAYWPQYQDSWVAWNHVRTVAALLAAILYTAALV